MILRDPGWLRPALAFVLAVLGVMLRFVMPSRLGAFGLKRFRTAPDEDIFLRVRGHLGTLLLLWAGWLLLQILLGMKESWTASVWAPLTLVAIVIPASFARLFLLRHQPGEVTSGLAGGFRGWIWIFLREAIPLGALLATILIVRSVAPRLPDEIPAGWDLRRGELVWTPREVGLTMLRHRTFVVYGVLVGLEGSYLIVRWLRNQRLDVARLMLSRPMWLYYLFKTGWVLLLAGFNLALLDRALEAGPGAAALLPGLAVLAALGFLIARRPAPSS